MSYQDELFEYFQNSYPNCEIKKINKDSNIDILIPDLYEQKNIHINFNVKKSGVDVRLHFVITELDEYRFYLEENVSNISAYGKRGSSSAGIAHNNKAIAYNKYNDIIKYAGELIDAFKNNLDSFLSDESVPNKSTTVSKIKQKSSEILSSFNEHLPSGETNDFQINLMQEVLRADGRAEDAEELAKDKVSKTNLINFFNHAAKNPDILSEISTPQDFGNEIDKESLIKLGLDQGYEFSEEDLKELPEMSGEDWKGEDMMGMFTMVTLTASRFNPIVFIMVK